MLTEFREMLAGLVLMISTAFGFDHGVADCNNPNPDARIRGCTEMIESGYFFSMNLSKAYNNRGIAYSDMGDLKQAIQNYDSAIETNSEFSDAFYNRGIAYGKLGENGIAIRDFDKSIELNPGDAEAFYNRGLAYSNGGNYDEAISNYSEALTLDPTHSEAFTNRGVALARKGELEKAVIDFDRAIEIDPSDANALYNRARINGAAGKVEEALKDHDRVVALEPQNAKNFHLRCLVRATNGFDLDQARADCDASLALANDPNALNSRGFVGLKQGRFDDAWKDYDTALRMAPGTASYHFGRGIAALRLGRTAEGNADLAAAIKLNGKIAEEYARYGVRP